MNYIWKWLGYGYTGNSDSTLSVVSPVGVGTFLNLEESSSGISEADSIQNDSYDNQETTSELTGAQFNEENTTDEDSNSEGKFVSVADENCSFLSLEDSLEGTGGKMLPQKHLLRRNSKRFVIGDETEETNEEPIEVIREQQQAEWNQNARFLRVGSSLT